MSKNSNFLRGLLGALTLVGLVVACYKYLDVHAMWQAWERFSWSTWGLFLVLPIFYLGFKAYRFYQLLEPISDAYRSAVMTGYASSQAASLLPGGVAMRAAMMHRLGVPVEKSSGPVLANSAADQFLLLTVGLVLCYYYQELRTSAFGLTALLIFLTVVLSVRSSRDWVAGLLRKAARKVNQEEKLEKFFENLPYLCNLELFGKAMFWTLLANLVSMVTLVAVVYSLDLPVDLWALTAAFVIPNLLGRLSPLPAGAGVVEAGMVGFMAAQAGMSYDQAAVATVI
ncbi:MAG: flippase-like domain-containing protein, partial [Candidatus Eremiobacteraeota bacterium]|nr:flippase-like domain-containing protein [Candidatus Eremiobacteraeota bacterium]